MKMPEKFISPSEEDIERFFHNCNSIITKNGGAVEADAEQRRVCLMFSSGDFLVSPEHYLSPSVRFLNEVCIRKGFKINRIYGVELKLIRLLYEVSERDLKKGIANDASLPMEKIVSDLLTECSYMHISDLHIKVYEHEADVQVRKNGELTLLRQIDSDIAHSILSTLYNAAEEADATYRIHAYQAARIVTSTSRIHIPDNVQAIRLQYNPLGQGGRYMIARFLYSEKQQKTIDPLSLGFHPIQCKQLALLRGLPIGVNIISGPTGSGKSTTLKVMLELLYNEKKKKVNIISIEDPPEYDIEGTAQLPITNVDTEIQRGIEYRKAIAAALRSDPDVIMPGEARDSEVINLVFTAAMTGHQVWTSLHANSAIAIFDRLKDQGVDDFKLSDPELITGLLAQRLVKKLCSHCALSIDQYRDYHELSADVERIIDDGYEKHTRFVNESGCKHCSSGYVGRTVISEVIIPDQKFLNMIIKGNRTEASNYWRESLDGLSMSEHAWIKVVNGEIDIHDAIQKLPSLATISSERKSYLYQLI